MTPQRIIELLSIEYPKACGPRPLHPTLWARTHIVDATRDPLTGLATVIFAARAGCDNISPDNMERTVPAARAAKECPANVRVPGNGMDLLGNRAVNGCRRSAGVVAMSVRTQSRASAFTPELGLQLSAGESTGRAVDHASNDIRAAGLSSSRCTAVPLTLTFRAEHDGHIADFYGVLSRA